MTGLGGGCLSSRYLVGVTYVAGPPVPVREFRRIVVDAVRAEPTRATPVCGRARRSRGGPSR